MLKIISQSRDGSVSGVALTLATLLAVFGSVWASQAEAAPTNQSLFSNSTLDKGMQTTNDGNAFTQRQNYFLRYPYAKAAFDADQKEKITNSPGSVFTKNGADSNTRDSVTGALGSTSSQSSNTPGNTINTLKSVKNNGPTPVLSYDIMIKPVGAPGHYLPGAAPDHQPQYFNPGEVPAYEQPKLVAQDQPLLKRDNEIFKNQLKTFSLPISDTQYQAIHRENGQRIMELALDPERWMWLGTSVAHLMGASASNSFAGAAEGAFNTATAQVVGGTAGGGPAAGGAGGFGDGAQVGALINIANENAGVPTSADNPNKTIPQAVWMVQTMYRQVFIPLAILFLLPGAVISQVKVQVQGGFSIQTQGTTNNPFEGILRSIIAIFLIPATQLIVSYSIDTGNSLSYSVKDWVSIPTIKDWAHNLTYNIPPGNEDNAILPPSNTSSGTKTPAGNSGDRSGGFFSSIGSMLSGIPGAQDFFNQLAGNSMFGAGDGDGIAANDTEDKSQTEQQLWLSQTMEMMFNMAMYIFSMAVIILGAFQVLLMSYLYLLGPLAAAFFAWPEIGSRQLFRNVFSNWLEAVINVALWRFYWMVILAVMSQRIDYVMAGGGVWNLQWEVAVFTCLLGLMVYAPFHPFEFDPRRAYNVSSQAGAQLMGGQAGGKGQQGGLSGAMGASAIANGANPEAVRSAQGAIAGVTDSMSRGGMGAEQRRQMDMGFSSDGVSRSPSGAAPGPGASLQGGPSMSSVSSNNVAPPPNAQTASFSSPSSAGPAQSQSTPSMAAAQQLMPNTAVMAQNGPPTPSLAPAAGASVTSPVAQVNPNVNPASVAPSIASQGGTTTQSAPTSVASAGAPSGGQTTPQSGASGSTGGSTGATGSSGTQMASNDSPSRTSASPPPGGSASSPQGNHPPDVSPPPSSMA